MLKNTAAIVNKLTALVHILWILVHIFIMTQTTVKSAMNSLNPQNFACIHASLEPIFRMVHYWLWPPAYRSPDLYP